ncbi:TonB-dependent receptor [Pedobacter chinensis]|uniref:TonB-dependent receptor n=1 Tax=Pedobacter chinensis TaxID=2282421 RepID=A0A369PRK9_9SPHI|nr:TonB-dependent receptor [Pedobacter chinensis]RDC55174.1 TonB-dependent receptor [Pedobacter chinensis]
MKFFFTTVIIFCLCPAITFAQKSGTLQGRVSDVNGNPLSGLTLQISNTNHKTQSDTGGRYRFEIQAGKYQLICSGIGYEISVREIEIHPAQRMTHDFRMKSLDQELQTVQINGKTAIQEVRETPFNVVALDARASYNTTLDLAHLLNKSSGVRIRETGGVGSDVAISLNGFTGRHVKVFIDGLPMQGFGSAFQLNNIPATMAERIEVYKGVVPIEFGADALGGVINIVTNQSANTYVDASYSYGSFNSHRTNINLNHTTKSGLSVQLSGIYNFSDNNYPVYGRIFDLDRNLLPLETQKVRRFNDKYENISFVGKIGFVGKAWADRFFIGLTAGKVDKGIQNANNLFTVFGERSSHSNMLAPTLSYDKRNLFTKRLSVRLNANYNYNSNTNIDTASRIYNWLGQSRPNRGRGEAVGTSSMTEFSNRNGSANANVSYSLDEKHSLSMNDVYTHFIRMPSSSLTAEELDETDLMRRMNIKNVLGISYRYRHSRNWNVNLFGKQYHTKAIGPENISTSNTGTSYVERTESFPAWGYGMATTYFLKDMQFKFSAEKAVRLPTEQELFGDELFEFGNLSLKPETSYNLNLGFLMNKALSEDHALYLDVNTYYRQIEDYIMRNIEQRFGTGFNTNHGRARNMGIDGELRYYYKDKIMLGATATYMDLRDKEKFRSATGTAISYTYDGRFPNVPYCFGNIDAAYYLHNLGHKGNTLNLGYALNFVGEFFLKPESFGSSEKATLPQQVYHDLIATYIMENGRYNITLEAKDFTNVRLFDNFGMEKPARVFNVKVRYFFMNRANKK